MENNIKKYVKLNCFAVQQKLTQHCIAPILQLKKKKDLRMMRGRHFEGQDGMLYETYASGCSFPVKGLLGRKH